MTVEIGKDFNVSMKCESDYFKKGAIQLKLRRYFLHLIMNIVNEKLEWEELGERAVFGLCGHHSWV